jgi:hypothetical protein
MIRRAMSLLAVLGYVAGQLAASPHLHADGSTPECHDTRPHIHFSGFGDDHHVHHYRHDSGEGHGNQGVSHSGQSGHDDDAIYLNVVIAGAPNASPSQIDLLHGSTWGAWLPPCGVATSLAFTQSVAWFKPCSHATADHCALFLTLQSLRI